MSKISVSFLISLSIAAIKLMMTDDLKFLRKSAEIRILFFVVKGFAQIHPKVLHCYATSVQFRSIVLFAPWRCYTRVLDNNEITYLTSSVGQIMSTTSVSFSISLSIAAISDQIIKQTS